MVNRTDTFVEAMTKVRDAVVRKTGYKEGDREWLSARLEHEGWPDGTQDIQIYARPGSPFKGYIIINYGTKTITGYDVRDNRISRWIYREESPKK